MKRIVRFGVSLEEDLLKRFDQILKEEGYTNRSEAIRDLIRRHLVEKEWEEGKEVAGGIILLYNHKVRELVDKLIDLQHDFGKFIISTQHIHLDEENCLEIVVVRGEAKEVKNLATRLGALRGVKHLSLAKTSTGKEIS